MTHSWSLIGCNETLGGKKETIEQGWIVKERKYKRNVGKKTKGRRQRKEEVGKDKGGAERKNETKSQEGSRGRREGRAFDAETDVR